ncbi:30S ribosomal protein S2 [Candidatus Berkelbacteria bacterium CG06_land_8_20_14_3_00_43_10]|uniref:Small ribosomal subunit protein uS2 n=1 Tax=Candidatus Berkelbacteria bacterium CG10_big_fil_rev_8_21_14_0_10_43_14 TaxID=1974515 RepID=A0A2M6R873_9BACT|nr:MAG: 30S ribosomal protein S2 [Candidatus Berkelbacteria bacterium CG2_30_43_20]PIS06697.1 MAG: 30S ribosomal protein S2 [Candidatus Berkelbacteria bacterium CG10_big_fil_rev_8_21_14_0_10_43_14]PIU87016.1 MAG: 30S ribosomal protein S2 [Candidatus Berkelbacteria bacterium CG06_land_8_20_14_3_00_43_10]
MSTALPTVEELFATGAHYGHVRERSHPKARARIYSTINKVHIIDLEKTHADLITAIAYLKQQSKEGKTILLVGTKRQAKDVIEKVGKEHGIAYLSTKWLGGTLTNFATIKENLKRLEDFETEAASPEFALKPKRYQATITTKIERLHKTLDGMKNLQKLPDILVIVDTNKENTAVTEAKRLDIPVVGVLDTNSNPEDVAYPVMINDDAPAAVSLVVTLLAEAIAEGAKSAPKKEEKGVEKSVKS